MPYDPYAPTENERSGVYFTVWIGFVASLVLLAATVLDLPDRVRGLAALLVGLQVFVFTVSPRFDSYFRQLRNFGACVAVTVLSLWLAGHGLLTLTSLGHAAGFAAGSGGSADVGPPNGLPALLADGWLVTGLSAVGFYAGFLFEHLRGGR